MVDEERRSSQRTAVQRIREGERYAVKLPVLGEVRVPRPEQLAYFGALAALAAVEIIDWPIALLIGTGHALMTNQHSRVAREVGEALDEA
jgi:xanthosine utilization system XapX-like protein